MGQMKEKSPLGESSDDLAAFFNSFFSEQEEDSRRWSHVQTYPALTEIFRHDDDANAAYLIEKGMVKLVRSAAEGCEIIVGVRSGHALIGGSALLLGKPYFYTAVTLVRSSLRYIPANSFLHLVKTNGQFSWQVNRLLSQALFNCMNRLEALGCMPARDRLELFLRELILHHEEAESHKAIEFPIPLKGQELAQILAVTPEHLCRLLREMEEEGVVRRNKGALVIVDPAAFVTKSKIA